MTNDLKKELLETQIGDKSLGDWVKLWEPLSSAFSVSHPELRHVPGLFRIILGDKTKYICRALEQPGGIAKGLQRIAGPTQTGNQAYGAKKIRENIDEVSVKILRLDQVSDPMKVGKELKRLMVKFYKPEWAEPAQMRMKKIRAGLRDPST